MQQNPHTPDPFTLGGKVFTSRLMTGTGKFTLSGVNTYTGPTNVNAGPLELSSTGTSAVGSTLITVDPAATLRTNVTSPGGTTQAALQVLMGPEGLKQLMARAVAAALRGDSALGPARQSRYRRHIRC